MKSETLPDPRNAKEHCQSFFKKEKQKINKQSEIISYQPRTSKNPTPVDIKLVITEHPKTLHNLSKVEKVGSNSSLYSDTEKSKKFLNEKNVKMAKQEHAFKGYASTYNLEILNSFNPELQQIINESDIDDVFQSIYTTIITNIQKSFGKVSGSIIDLVIDHTISISKYNPLVGSSYIKSPKESDHPRKSLINIQNTDDNECFKWRLVRYLNPANHHPARITKVKILLKSLTLKT